MRPLFAFFSFEFKEKKFPKSCMVFSLVLASESKAVRDTAVFEGFHYVRNCRSFP
jgi:hypothetical protein